MVLKRINSPLNIDGNIGWERFVFLIAKYKDVRRIFFFFFIYSGDSTLGDSLRILIKIDHQNETFYIFYLFYLQRLRSKSKTGESSTFAKSVKR